ncbi:MAG TPA: folylpolyglutamate synthase/dihydrofolate synthase family protein [Vicinamibacterales bacterium]|nr:folylpolyglutamate synthase/dihydrofolate synthase family protein [Vicinamibacterales bacterium]
MTPSVLDRLFALETFGIKLGLDNITSLCEGLGHPERRFTSLHVAGTNGKGSVTAMTHAALRAAGVHAGRYTSPHLTDVAERFVVGDRPVDSATLEAAVSDVLECADRLRQTGVLPAQPTFFEATTAAAFEMFRRSRIEVGVIEVGLGGRFDATNVVSPVAGAITTIDFDHQQHLGNTLEAIAFEKAGIIKTGMTIVLGALPREARDVIQQVAAERGATLVESALDTRCETEMLDGRAHMTLETPHGAYGPVTLGLRGEHQTGNAVVAVRLLEAAAARGIRIPRDAIERGLAEAQWPARLELLPLDHGRRVLLDAAHNPEGARALASYLRRWHAERPPLVIGVMRDKNVAEIAQTLLPHVSTVIATAAPTPRAIPPEDLARHLRAAGAREVTVEPDAARAIDRALEKAPMVCVAGSIFLVGAVRDGLLRRAILR